MLAFHRWKCFGEGQDQKWASVLKKARKGRVGRYVQTGPVDTRLRMRGIDTSTRWVRPTKTVRPGRTPCHNPDFTQTIAEEDSDGPASNLDR